VAYAFGVATCRTVASPALGDTQQGKTAASAWIEAAQSVRGWRGNNPAEAAVASRPDHAAALAEASVTVEQNWR